MNYSEQNDAMLVALTLTGNQSAYESLVIRWQKAVLASANAITHNSYMAEDAAQDAFVSAWMKLDSLREADKFGAWVCRIAKNRAKNIISRYREWVSLDDLLNIDETADHFPEELIGVTDPHEALHDSIGALPEKVRQVIHLHYFEGYSIAEIADRLREPIGTVKWRLSEGRKIIRKDLSAMNERIDDTLVEKVMKRVEELKNWRLKNSQAGFEAAYKEVLVAVEELPESKEKYHAMAEVLQLGWWWLPGAKNDALRARIKEAAEKGGNLDVLCKIIHGESNKLSGKEKIEFIREKQIPLLEEIGYPEGLAEEWFWLGVALRDDEQIDEALNCFGKVLEIAPPSYVYYGNAKAAIECETWARDKDYEKIQYGACGEEYHMVDGAPRFWSQPGYSRGQGIEDEEAIYYYASRCDSYFIDPSMKVGEVKLATDGETTLTFAADDVAVETPCGKFDNCQKWVTDYTNRQGSVMTVYYMDGVGIVRYERSRSAETCTYHLTDYRICGGVGFFPWATGNYWEYQNADVDSNCLMQIEKYEITGCEDNRCVLSSVRLSERIAWEEDNWKETMRRIRMGYWKEVSADCHQLVDVRPLMTQAESLVSTEYQKVHTRVANKVMNRILDTDTDFNPDATHDGCWNFFQRYDVVETDRGYNIEDYTARAYSFEWKAGCGGDRYPLLMNFMYDLIADPMDCVWSDDWKPGLVTTITKERWRGTVLTIDLAVSDAGTITTPAGAFDNCLSVALNIKGYSGGLAYQGDHKTFYYAPSIGIVRMDSADAEGKPNARYELTAYEGVGKDNEFFPVFDGLFRRYEAQGLPEHLIGATEYTCVTSPNGSLVLLVDQIGVEKIKK